MKTGDLGKEYSNGDIICEQGEPGQCMYVIQSGQVEVEYGDGDSKISLGKLEKRDFFGEMALFEKEPRSATVKAVGKTRVLAVDKRTLLRRIQEDPSFAFRLIQKMSSRIREMTEKLAQAKREEQA